MAGLYDCIRSDGLLPLNKSWLKTIAVLGPSANDTAGYERCFDLDFGLPAGGGCLYSHIYRGYSSSLSTPLMGICAHDRIAADTRSLIHEYSNH